MHPLMYPMKRPVSSCVGTPRAATQRNPPFASRSLNSRSQVHRRDPAVHGWLDRALRSPSLYDECLRLLARRGYEIPATSLERDWSEPYAASEGVAAAWLHVYRNAEEHWDLYELAEKLVDLDHQFQLWRFSHMKTVERIIGYKRGTGGTGGVSYLAKALELRFFPELWTVRTSM